MEPNAKQLLSAITKYKAATEAAERCPDLIWSSGRTEEAARLMRELYAARDHLFSFVSGTNAVRRRCMQCGYVWDEKPLDAKPETPKA